VAKTTPILEPRLRLGQCARPQTQPRRKSSNPSGGNFTRQRLGVRRQSD